jgi:hypothetical protein
MIASIKQVISPFFASSFINLFFFSDQLHNFLRLQNMTPTSVCSITQIHTLLQLAAEENNKQEKKNNNNNNTYQENEQKSVYFITEALFSHKHRSATNERQRWKRIDVQNLS